MRTEPYKYCVILCKGLEPQRALGLTGVDHRDNSLWPQENSVSVSPSPLSLCVCLCVHMCVLVCMRISTTHHTPGINKIRKTKEKKFNLKFQCFLLPYKCSREL